MNYHEFRHLVNEMREAQRTYFRTRSPEVLDRSKKLERAVDKALSEHDGGQSKLFEERGE